MTSKNRRRQKNKDLSKKVAEERILLLFERAEQSFKEHPKRTYRYVTLARLIGMHYRVRPAREQKRRLCRHCYHYLVPGNNCRIRLKGGAVLTTCFACGKMSRYPYRKTPQKDSV
ncbi:MAG: ribonuclease P [Methanimicrococcus sp.]|nr:ribonuclease P [Methanimicrococcus sp.]